jgi:hypothetical protein
LNTTATPQTKTGTLTATELTASAGNVEFTVAGTGSKIENIPAVPSVSDGTLTISSSILTDNLNLRLGTTGEDTLRLRHNANGGGTGVPRNCLEI